MILRALVLGHKGMLGHLVDRFIRSENIGVLTTELRWSTQKFKDEIKALAQNVDIIINCAGAIPQYHNNFNINYELPIWLEKNTGRKIIYPGSDCESIENPYSRSKLKAADWIRKNGKNTKILRTSIIGPELGRTSSLMEWFLAQKQSVAGFSECFWTGNTTLTWAKYATNIAKNWEKYGRETVLASPRISKHELLLQIKEIFRKEISVYKDDTVRIDRTLVGVPTPHIKIQLQELKDFMEQKR